MQFEAKPVEISIFELIQSIKKRQFDISNDLPITYCLDRYNDLIEHMEYEVEGIRENKDIFQCYSMGIEWDFDFINYAKEKGFITKKEMSDYRAFDNTINCMNSD